jgi:aryl-phospho-beta-D-glucosidase BglC (GH1 family)
MVKNFTEFEGWSTWRGYGVNLGKLILISCIVTCVLTIMRSGGWLVIETSITPDIWINGGANVTDEWTFCQTVGKERCGPLLEEHYATFITNATIDKLATVNVNTVRIPSTYAAWVDVPESELYHGHQLKYLRDVTDYAISTYGMHVIIDLHSLPGK